MQYVGMVCHEIIVDACGLINYWITANHVTYPTPHAANCREADAAVLQKSLVMIRTTRSGQGYCAWLLTIP